MTSLQAAQQTQQAAATMQQMDEALAKELLALAAVDVAATLPDAKAWLAQKGVTSIEGLGGSPELLDSFLDCIKVTTAIPRSKFKRACVARAAAVESARAAAAEEAAAALELLQPMQKAGVADAPTLELAAAWCKKEGAESAQDIAEDPEVISLFLDALSLGGEPRGRLEQALLGKEVAPAAPPMPPAPRPHAASSSSHTNYQGLTNEEDFEQVERATKVDIISTPFDEANPVAGRKAAATKDFHDNAAAGIYTFNPNSGLKAAAEARNMTPEEQGKKWLELWTKVAMKVQETGGTCFVIVKGTGPGPDDFVIEGNAQKGELNVAELAGIPIEYVKY